MQAWPGGKPASYTTLLYRKHGTSCSWSQSTSLWSSMVSQRLACTGVCTSSLMCLLCIEPLVVWVLTIQSKVMCWTIRVDRFTCNKADAVPGNLLWKGLSFTDTQALLLVQDKYTKTCPPYGCTAISSCLMPLMLVLFLSSS